MTDSIQSYLEYTGCSCYSCGAPAKATVITRLGLKRFVCLGCYAYILRSGKYQTDATRNLAVSNV